MASVTITVDDGDQVGRRGDAIERARASSRLEGLDLDPATLALTERYVKGELSSDQLLEEMIRLPL
jgi:hypothetical protein